MGWKDRAARSDYENANREMIREQTRERQRRFRERGGKGKYRRRIAGQAGIKYRTREEISAAKQERIAILRARRTAREGAGPKENTWIKRLREELPCLYDSNLKPNALVWRARYYLDPAYKAYEIERTSKRDAARPLLDDGSLTPDVINKLFTRKDCPYCGKQMVSKEKTLDHIMPRHLGGWHSVHNSIVCCYGCNSKKQARSPIEWLRQLPFNQARITEREWKRAACAEVRQGWLTAS